MIKKNEMRLRECRFLITRNEPFAPAAMLPPERPGMGEGSIQIQPSSGNTYIPDFGRGGRVTVTSEDLGEFTRDGWTRSGGDDECVLLPPQREGMFTFKLSSGGQYSPDFNRGGCVTVRCELDLGELIRDGWRIEGEK